MKVDEVLNRHVHTHMSLIGEGLTLVKWCVEEVAKRRACED